MTKRMHIVLVALVALVCLTGNMLGAEAAAPAAFSGEDTPTCWTAGGDIRIRQVHLDNIPIIADPPGVTRGGENHFFRFRTRLWASVDPAENITVKGRVVNEFRHYEEPENGSWDALDELIVDQLYIDLNNLFDGKVDVRAGRQDLIYGTGKVILEGTPKDGSRTIYHDAVRVRYRPCEKTTVDILGIHNEPENELAIHSMDRDLTGWDPAYNDATESGGGVYIKNKDAVGMPVELYYLYKNESDWVNRGGAMVDGRNVHTVGARVTPKLADAVDANIEAAYQFGEKLDAAETDVEGYMVDATLNVHLPILEDAKPCVGAGVYMLSGDDPGTPEDEGWDPLWARWPQYSELYIYAFDADGAGRWSNVLMPHIDLTLMLGGVKVRGMAAYMMANEDNGPGPGDERGVLLTARADFTLAKGLLCDKDKLFAHVTGEYLEPGDYYNVDDAAHFLRWELSYAF